jgi:hypothetical protein
MTYPFKRITSLFFVGVLIAVSGHAQSVLTNGLVAYYGFDGNASDASGNGHNGSIFGATFTTNRFGQFSAALQFNSASGNYVSTTFLPPTGTNGRTFSVWFNSTNNNQEKVILSYGAFNTYPGDRVELKLLSDGSVALGSSNLGIQTLSTWGDGKWHQFVVVIPTNGAVAGVQLFVDGKPQTLVYYNPFGATVFNTATNTALEIGDLQYTGQGFFNGILDDLRIYNIPLTTNQVAQLFVIESGPIMGLAYAVKPTFDNLWVGTNYQLQISTSLSGTFTNYGSTFTATNISMVYTQYFDVANWNHLFFRLKVLP